MRGAIWRLGWGEGEQLLISGYSVAKVSLLQKTQKNKCHKMNKEKIKGGGLSEKLCLQGAGARNCWKIGRASCRERVYPRV